MEGYSKIAESAYQNAVNLVGPHSHFADRMTVAQHAARRSDAPVVAGLLDGHVEEDHDNEPLRALARAFVNDTPIRRRAVAFFSRLPPQVRELPLYLHAEGLLHFNRGDLKQAEACLRKATKPGIDLTAFLALFATLRRDNRREQVKPILEIIDLKKVQGTPGQKMYLAQELLAADLSETAFSFAYEVLKQSRNDSEAALRYFGLMMLDPNGGHVPHPTAVAIDTWVRLESEHNDSDSFLVVDGEDRPADGVLSMKHPLVVAARGLSVGDEFEIKAALGSGTKWRVAEIKHKYVHALHDVLYNFQTRFPNAKGLYSFKINQGDIQPVLEQVRQKSETTRQIADFYLVKHIPMTMVASFLGRDSVGFANYVRVLGHNIHTCIGTHAERVASLRIIRDHRSRGAVLDAYTAWTAATMDILDVLHFVFGTLVLPRSCIDELRTLLNQENLDGGRKFSILWRDGQYFREEFTAEQLEAQDHCVSDQIERIKRACKIVPAAATDSPSELARALTATFGSGILVH
jgi:hypothetical protein